jgi:hypothetical protein
MSLASSLVTSLSTAAQNYSFEAYVSLSWVGCVQTEGDSGDASKGDTASAWS